MLVDTLTESRLRRTIALGAGDEVIVLGHATELSAFAVNLITLNYLPADLSDMALGIVPIENGWRAPNVHTSIVLTTSQSAQALIDALTTAKEWLTKQEKKHGKELCQRTNGGAKPCRSTRSDTFNRTR